MNANTILTTNISNGNGSISVVRVSQPLRTARSKTLDKINRQLIDNNLIMKQSEKTRICNERVNKLIYFTPKPQCGFNLKVMTCMDGYQLDWDVDPRRIVSLACMSECADLPININFRECAPHTGSGVGSGKRRCIGNDDEHFNMEVYISKLPLMCLNASRLVYTTRAFGYKKNPNWNIGLKALDFYLKYDTSYSNHHQLTASSGIIDLSTNLDFSNLLHRLRSSGYLEYIIELGRCLAYDVEVILGGDNKRKVYVYKYVGGGLFAEGVLTAYYNEAQWYVYVSTHSRVRNETDIVDLVKR